MRTLKQSNKKAADIASGETLSLISEPETLDQG